MPLLELPSIASDFEKEAEPAWVDFSSATRLRKGASYVDFEMRLDLFNKSKTQMEDAQIYKEFVVTKSVALPRPLPPLNMTFEQTLLQRESGANFRDEPLSL